MIHAVKVGGENGRFVSTRSGTDFYNGIAVFVLIRRQQGDLNIPFKIGHSLFKLRNLIVSHGGDSTSRDIASSRLSSNCLRATSSSSHFASSCLMFACSRMISLARWWLEKSAGSAISLSSCSKRLRFSLMRELKSIIVAVIADRGSGRGSPTPATESS